MPVDFTGYWKMLANENFEEYLRALDVNVALRKIANLLKPDKEIVQEGDHMIIRTLSTFRNYIMDFQVGKEFEEDLTGIDDRKCMADGWRHSDLWSPGSLSSHFQPVLFRSLHDCKQSGLSSWWKCVKPGSSFSPPPPACLYPLK
uniref:Retinol binding protein 1 n=1 Tax=Bos taurus TaxID=9913 RepID=A0ABI0NQ20_BOVIN